MEIKASPGNRVEPTPRVEANQAPRREGENREGDSAQTRNVPSAFSLPSAGPDGSPPFAPSVDPRTDPASNSLSLGGLHHTANFQNADGARAFLKDLGLDPDDRTSMNGKGLRGQIAVTALSAYQYLSTSRPTETVS